MDVRPGYKQTEVGVIPEEWEIRTIGQMFRLINGCAFKPEDWKQSGTPIIRIQNLDDPSAPFNFSQTPVPQRNRVESGDLLFAWSGTIGTSFGARVWEGPSGVLNQHIFKVLMDEQQITSPFSLLVFSRVEDDIAKQAHGFKASFVHVKKSDLVKVHLPIPPLPEQRAIATALSDVRALLGGLDRLLAKKRDLKQAAMQQLMTGQTRLPGFHGEWEWKRLGDVVDVRKGQLITGNTKGVGEIPVVAGGKQPAYYHNVANRQGRTVTISASGASAGYVAKYSTPIFASDCSTIGESEHYCLGFVFYQLVLKQQLIYKAQTGGAQPHIHPVDVMPIEVAVPPLAEQNAIAAVLTDMDAELAALEGRRDKTRDLKQAMMQELLTGKTRLVPAGGADA